MSELAMHVNETNHEDTQDTDYSNHLKYHTLHGNLSP